MSSDGIKTVSSVKLVFIKAVNGRVKHVNQELVTNLRMLSAGLYESKLLQEVSSINDLL